jgi:hypothetical protein
MVHGIRCDLGGFTYRPQLWARLARNKRMRIRLACQLAALLLLAGSVPVRAQDPQEKKDAVPAPAKWSILFRADDPSVWNKDAKGPDGVPIAVPLKSAPDNFSYLRLRRMDTREALIIAVTPEQLENGKAPTPEAGFWWNGGNKEEYEGRHLGIAHGPRYKFPVPHGMIAVMEDGWDGFTGSGFGHKCFVNDGQYYCWLGKEIKKTAFEIAVSEGPLGPEEKRLLVGPNTKTPPLPAVHVERAGAAPKSTKPAVAFANSSRLTRTLFEKIQNGMTEKEVLDILGPANGSSTKTITTNGQTKTTKGLTWRQSDPNITITVKLTNGEVSGKNCIQVGPIKK